MPAMHVVAPLLLSLTILFGAPLDAQGHAPDSGPARAVAAAMEAMRKGDWIMLCYGSGNRDETMFENPDVFRADRSPNPLISFGYGPHLCLGMHLAKLEMRILFEELLPKLKSIRFDGTPEIMASLFINGPKKLPIRFEAA